MNHTEGTVDGPPVAVIVTFGRDPAQLDLCLRALGQQTFEEFELIVADDGSVSGASEVIDRHRDVLGSRLTHLFSSDGSPGKSKMLNQAIASTQAEYLVFLDSACIVPPSFLDEHVRGAEYGYCITGKLIHLDEELSATLTPETIDSGKAFDAAWLKEVNGKGDRQFFRLSLPYRIRSWLNRNTPGNLPWLSENGACFRADAVAVNGFDNCLSLGAENTDFGNRLVNFGLEPASVCWTAAALCLDRGDSAPAPEGHETQSRESTQIEAGGEYRCADGLVNLDQQHGRVAAG